MGIYLNPGNENFRRITNADIYVDKTMMISLSVLQQKKCSSSVKKPVSLIRSAADGMMDTGSMVTKYIIRNQ